MSYTQKIAIRPNPSMNFDDSASGSMPEAGSPVFVNIVIPDDLIEQARIYPTVDWNAVMRDAVAARLVK